MADIKVGDEVIHMGQVRRVTLAGTSPQGVPVVGLEGLVTVVPVSDIVPVREFKEAQPCRQLKMF